jgi:hypothetical protein
MTSTDHAYAATVFHPLADRDKRIAYPLGALEAARCLEEIIEIGCQHAVEVARANGSTWAEIGRALGMTRQAAQQRFGLLATDHSPGCKCGTTAACSAHLVPPKG